MSLGLCVHVCLRVHVCVCVCVRVWLAGRGCGTLVCLQAVQLWKRCPSDLSMLSRVGIQVGHSLLPIQL